MRPKYILVTDASAAEVTAATGLVARSHPLGVVIENPEPDWESINLQMTALRKTLEPKPRNSCNCMGIHRWGCPMFCAA